MAMDAASRNMGYTDEGAGLAKPHAAPATAVAPGGAPGKQLNSNESSDIGGPAGQILGRVGHFASGIASGRGDLPGGMNLPGMGGAAEGAAGAGEAAAGAAGVGEIAADLAPLALLT